MNKSTKPKAPWTRAFPKQAAVLHPKRSPLMATAHAVLSNGKEIQFKGIVTWNPLRRRSRRMTKLMQFYNLKKIVFLARQPQCAVHKDAFKCEATQIHHSRGRLLTLLLDTRYWKGVCQAGHDWIQCDPKDARELGVLCARGDWNRAPADDETKRLRELMKEITK